MDGTGHGVSFACTQCAGSRRAGPLTTVKNGKNGPPATPARRAKGLTLDLDRGQAGPSRPGRTPGLTSRLSSPPVRLPSTSKETSVETNHKHLLVAIALLCWALIA